MFQRTVACACELWIVTRVVWRRQKSLQAPPDRPHNPTRSEGLAVARFSAPRLLLSDKILQVLLKNGLSNGE